MLVDNAKWFFYRQVVEFRYPLFCFTELEKLCHFFLIQDLIPNIIRPTEMGRKRSRTIAKSK